MVSAQTFAEIRYVNLQEDSCAIGNGMAIQAVACIFFTPFFSAVYNQERLILQTIYVLNKEMWA